MVTSRKWQRYGQWEAVLNTEALCSPYILLFIMSNIAYIQFYTTPIKSQLWMPKMATEFADFHQILDEQAQDNTLIDFPKRKGFSITTRQRRLLNNSMTKL